MVGKRQEARGKRQEARGKRQEARGKRQEARGKRQRVESRKVGKDKAEWLEKLLVMKIFGYDIGQKGVIGYCVRFLGLFCVLYYGTEAIIGLSSPEGGYNAFVAEHLNFIDPYRHFLLRSAQNLLSVGGYKTYFRDAFSLSFVGGRGIRMVYSCLGYGLLSFWISFVFANKGGWKRKAVWMVSGCVALIAINIARLSLVLLADNKGWPIPLGWDHHTWFNIIAYMLIFLMMFLFDRSARRTQKKESEERLQTSAKTVVSHTENIASPAEA